MPANHAMASRIKAGLLGFTVRRRTCSSHVLLAEKLAAQEAAELRVFQQAIDAATEAKAQDELEAVRMIERAAERKRLRALADERLERIMQGAAAEEAFEVIRPTAG